VHPAGEASGLRGDGGGWVRRKPGKKLQSNWRDGDVGLNHAK
jgi:hypothetical protein